MKRIFLGDPDVQSSVQILSQVVEGDTVVTRYKIGRLTVTGRHSRPSDQAMQSFRESLDTALHERADREARCENRNRPLVVA